MYCFFRKEYERDLKIIFCSQVENGFFPLFLLFSKLAGKIIKQKRRRKEVKI
jgi:hypothetical protein